MSAFKDAIKNDVKKTFINLDEFADTHKLNGVNVSCIIDKDLTQETAARNRDLEGVFLNTVTVYVAASDLTARPVEGELLKIDGSFHLVQSVSDEDGIYAIVCVENQQ